MKWVKRLFYAYGDVMMNDATAIRTLEILLSLLIALIGSIPSIYALKSLRAKLRANKPVVEANVDKTEMETLDAGTEAAIKIMTGSKEMVDWYKNELTLLRGDYSVLIQRVDILSKQVSSLIESKANLECKNAELDSSNKVLEGRVRELETVVRRLDRQIRDLGATPDYGNARHIEATISGDLGE